MHFCDCQPIEKLVLGYSRANSVAKNNKPKRHLKHQMCFKMFTSQTEGVTFVKLPRHLCLKSSG